LSPEFMRATFAVRASISIVVAGMAGERLRENGRVGIVMLVNHLYRVRRDIPGVYRYAETVAGALPSSAKKC